LAQPRHYRRFTSDERSARAATARPDVTTLLEAADVTPAGEARTDAEAAGEGVALGKGTLGARDSLPVTTSTMTCKITARLCLVT
jgi:hypothetical protein